jgi:DNA recombination protein RmuC
MEAFLIVVAVVVLLLVVLWGQHRTRRQIEEWKAGQQADPSILLMQQQIGQLTQQIGDRLSQVGTALTDQLDKVTTQVNLRLSEQSQVLQRTNESLGERLDKASRVVGEVQHKLGSLEKASQQIYEIGKDIASLQEILKTPKLRGGLGEFFLGDLLAQILPPEHFTLQHAFKSKETVDAVIRFEQGLVPVDAKFPLENFRRFIEATEEGERKGARKAFVQDVKKHVDAIAQKYIRPDEGTFDFALMYIPAENVYYETILRDAEKEERTISDYALEKRVIPVSPNTLYAYLRAILLGLRGMRIEKEARAVFDALKGLQQEFAKFREEIALLGTHLTRAQNTFGSVEKKADRFGTKLEQAEHPAISQEQRALSNETDA